MGRLRKLLSRRQPQAETDVTESLLSEAELPVKEDVAAEPKINCIQPALSDIVQDEDVEMGIPLNESTGKKSNVTKAGIACIGLIGVGAVVAGLIRMTSGSDESDNNPVQPASAPVNMTPKDFNKDKEQLALEAAAASAAAASAATDKAASEPVAGATADSGSVADGHNTSTTDTAMNHDSMTTTDAPTSNRARRLGGEVVLSVNNGQSFTGSGHVAGSLQPVNGDSDSLDSADSGRNSHFGNKLTPTATPGSMAQVRHNQSMLLTKGTHIQCVLETRIITTQPGFTRCQVAHDVYSADGKVLLVERGSKIIGEQTAAMLQGQARVFVLWNELDTPKGVKVSLASPGSGALGEGGHEASVNYHFWQRFGGAMMVSMIGDFGDYLSNRGHKNGSNNNITYDNTSDAAQQLATEVLRNSINIPPTGTINQGTLLNVMVARDVDFSKVYEVVSRPILF